MSRIGNIEKVVFLPVDCGLEDPMHKTHPKSMASLENIEINFHDSDVYCTTIPMTEICSFSFFNRELNVHRKQIDDCLRSLMEQGNEANKDGKFVHGTA